MRVEFDAVIQSAAKSPLTDFPRLKWRLIWIKLLRCEHGNGLAEISVAHVVADLEQALRVGIVRNKVTREKL